MGWRPADSQNVRSDTEEMPARGFISFKYQTLFLSLLRPVPCVFEGQPVKNPKVAVWHPIHIHQAAFLPLSLGHSLTLLFQADTAELSAVTHIPQFQTQFSGRLQSKCFVVNSWTLSPSLWVFLKSAEMNYLVDPSSPSFKSTDIKTISNVSYRLS